MAIKVTTDPRSHQHGLKLCAEWAKQQRGVMNFDAIYRHLVEQGLAPNAAHLAVEEYMRANMMKRVRPR